MQIISTNRIESFSEWLTENELSESTVRQYTATVNSFLNSYGMTKQDMLAYKSRLLRSCSARTVNVKLAAVQKYFEFADIACSVKRVKIQKASHIENVITAEQYRKLIHGLEQDGLERWIFNIKLISMTGARISEVLRITKADIVRGYAVMFTKGKIRTIQIPQAIGEEFADYMDNMQDTDKAVQNRNGLPMSRQSFANVLRSFSRYGIPREVLHPHSFRHFFAVEFLKRNNNIALLADLLGHSTVNTTMIYLRMSQEQQKRAVDAFVDW